MYDAIVVGARCAGSSTAMLLARLGYRILMIDRATFPSDTMSTHWIHQPGLASLKRWGLLERVLQTSAPVIDKVTFDFGPLALSGCSPAVDGVGYACAPRRTILDQIILDAAVEAGVEVRQGVAVQDVVRDGSGAVVGVRASAAGGKATEERAKIVIGADGMHSPIARLVEAPIYNEVPSLTTFYYSYWSGVSADGVEMCPREHRGVGLIPTNDGLVCAGAAWHAHEFSEFRTDVEGNLMRTFDLVPGFGERLRAGRREEPIRGTANQPNFFRKPFGRGWALVGDAGYYRDAITAQGISDAFRDAELLAGAIDDGFSRRRPLEKSLADYELTRNEAVEPMYAFTVELARLATPPLDLAQLLAALVGNQTQTDRFLGVVAGAVPIPDFFAPDNVRAILQAA